MEMKYPLCENGHIAHLEHDGSFATPFVWVVCDDCNYRSDRYDSEQECEVKHKFWSKAIAV